MIWELSNSISLASSKSSINLESLIKELHKFKNSKSWQKNLLSELKVAQKEARNQDGQIFDGIWLDFCTEVGAVDDREEKSR